MGHLFLLLNLVTTQGGFAPQVVVDAEQIYQAEQIVPEGSLTHCMRAPCTVISLKNGTRVWVRETPADIYKQLTEGNAKRD